MRRHDLTTVLFVCTLVLLSNIAATLGGVSPFAGS